MASFDYLILHCTATPAGRWVSPRQVQDWHTRPEPAGRGWKRAGYSDLILLDGTRHVYVQHDRDMEIDPWEITNGVAGLNAVARHLCYVGGLDASGKVAADTRTPRQLEAMAAIITEVLAYAPKVKIAGHNQFARKDCPSFFAPVWLQQAGMPPACIAWRDPYGYGRHFGHPPHVR